MRTAPGFGFSTYLQERYDKKELNRRMGWLKYVKGYSCHDTLRQLYISLLRSKMTYGILLKEAQHLEALRKIQNQAMRLISGSMPSTPISSLEDYLDICPIQQARKAAAYRHLAELSDFSSTELALHNDEWVQAIAEDDSLDDRYDASPYGHTYFAQQTLAEHHQEICGTTYLHWTEDALWPKSSMNQWSISQDQTGNPVGSALKDTTPLATEASTNPFN